RANGGTVSFSRTTDIASPAPTAIMYKFNLAVIGSNSSPATPCATLRVGSGFTTGNADEADANTYAKPGINLTTTSGQYQLRNLATSQNTPNISGNPAITWVINKTASTITYIAPTGSSATVGAGKMDVWVGTTLNTGFDEMAVTGNGALTDL